MELDFETFFNLTQAAIRGREKEDLHAFWLTQVPYMSEFIPFEKYYESLQKPRVHPQKRSKEELLALADKVRAAEYTSEVSDLLPTR